MNYNMKKFDDNIDNIFRKKLEDGENHIEFRENDWHALEEKLNRRSTKIFWSRMLSAAAVLLLVFLSSWLIINWISINGKNSSPTGNVQAVLPSPSKPTLPPPENQSKPLNSGNNTKIKKKAINDGSKANISNTLTVTSSNQQKLRMSQKQLNISEISTIKPQIIAQAETIPINRGNTAMFNTQHNISPSSPFITNEHTSEKWNKYNVSLFASTDMNGAGNFHYNSVGGDIGVLLSAHLFENWTVSTGAVYAKKPYSITFSQYDKNGGYPFPGRPDEVHADCRVLDIPLNIFYTIMNRKKDRISLGSGISSYIMLKEDYYFNYASSYNVNAKELSITNQNRHWFSVVNFQISYERKLTPNLSMGLEPYLKLPINNIGYGRVKLQSMGMALKLSWGFSQF